MYCWFYCACCLETSCSNEENNGRLLNHFTAVIEKIKPLYKVWICTLYLFFPLLVLFSQECVVEPLIL